MLERYVPDIVMEHVIQSTHEAVRERDNDRGASPSFAPPSASAAATTTTNEPAQRLYEQDAVVVLADISGFTKLAERLAKDNTRGEGRGTETLSRKLNSYFGRMIDMIYEGGGDVVKFAGDALLVVWREQSGRSNACHRWCHKGVAAWILGPRCREGGLLDRDRTFVETRRGARL